MTYKVFVDDNFHYMDESERYALGEFDTLDAALAAARRIVDEFLASAYKKGMSVGELYSQYSFFGEDPFIICTGGPAVTFSARDYASQRCREICGSSGGKS